MSGSTSGLLTNFAAVISKGQLGDCVCVVLAVCRCLQLDRDEIETLRQARLLEEEKAQYSVCFLRSRCCYCCWDA